MSRISDDELQRYCLTSCSSDEIANKGGMFVHRVALDCRDARSEIARLTEERDSLGGMAQAARLRADIAEARLDAATTVTDEDVERIGEAIATAQGYKSWAEGLEFRKEPFRQAARAALTAFVASKQSGAGEGENQEPCESTAAGIWREAASIADACYREMTHGGSPWDEGMRDMAVRIGNRIRKRAGAEAGVVAS